MMICKRLREHVIPQQIKALLSSVLSKIIIEMNIERTGVSTGKSLIEGMRLELGLVQS